MNGIDKTDESGGDVKAPVERRPRRARRNVTELASAILARDVRKISLMVTKAALDGDMQAAKLVLGLLIPVPKDRAVKFTVPEIRNAEDGQAAVSAVLAACGAGALTPAEAKTLSDIIHKKVEVSHMAAVEARVAQLEAQQSGKQLEYRRVG
jgi:hypothetical protein